VSSGQEKTCKCRTCIAERGCTWDEYMTRNRPAPSPQPEMPEGLECIDYRADNESLRVQLETARAEWKKAESERDTARAELAVIKSQRDDNENAWSCEKQKRLQAESERDTRDKQISALLLAFDRGVAERDTALKQVALQESWRKSAESERDTARADYARVVKLMRDKDAQWHRRQEGWRESSDDHYAALQTRVARAVAELQEEHALALGCVRRALEALR
jgi:hypothetical protein